MRSTNLFRPGECRHRPAANRDGRRRCAIDSRPGKIRAALSNTSDLRRCLADARTLEYFERIEVHEKSRIIVAAQESGARRCRRLGRGGKKPKAHADIVSTTRGAKTPRVAYRDAICMS